MFIKNRQINIYMTENITAPHVDGKELADSTMSFKEHLKHVMGEGNYCDQVGVLSLLDSFYVSNTIRQNPYIRPVSSIRFTNCLNVVFIGIRIEINVLLPIIQ